MHLFTNLFIDFRENALPMSLLLLASLLIVAPLLLSLLLLVSLQLTLLV
jgi:hypothetical protein